MLQRRVYLLWLLAGFALAPVAGHSAEPRAESAKAAPASDADIDEELLEFLGSVDSDDADWIEYLSQTDIAKVAKESADKTPAPKSTVKTDE